MMNFIEWLAKNSFTKDVLPEGGVERWSRPMQYGHKPCLEDGNLSVHILRYIATGSISMDIGGKGRYFYVSINVDFDSEEAFLKEAKNTEHRLQSAWMELVS